MSRIAFEVPGIPVAKGSARAFVVGKRAIVSQTNAARQRPWASAITLQARDAMQAAGLALFRGPVRVGLRFWMPRPKAHYRTGRHAGELRPDAPTDHASKPDLDKLERLVLDALTGVVWVDDGQVSSFSFLYKAYGPQPGVGIEVDGIAAPAAGRGQG